MKDMTQGSPTKLIIGFAIPMLIGNIFQQIYNVVDTIIVGRYWGEDALAGVGSTGTLTFFLLALVMGLCNGAGLVVAQCFGCKDMNKLQQSVAALVWVASLMTIFVSFLGLSCSHFFLKLLNVPEHVIGYSTEYLRVIYTFVAGNVAYNGASSILRSTGDSKTPLFALIAASVINIILDITFILVCNMGVCGVAYATVLSQHLSAVICISYLVWKRRSIGLTGMNWKPRKASVVLIIKTGFPSAFQSCMISLGGMSVQRLVNSYGSSVMAAYVAANRIGSIAIQVIVSIGIAYIIAGIMQSYQNIIRGSGDVNTCMVAGLTELAGRIVFAYLLSPFLGSTGIWIATPLSWSSGCIIPVIRYYSGKWKTKKLI